jgi:hypothetical protein
MDTPTKIEVVMATIRGNMGLKDILRFKKVSSLFSIDEVTEIVEPDFKLTASDYISRAHNTNTEELANHVIVQVNKFEVKDGKPNKLDNESNTVTEINAESIERYGLATYEYPNNDLIQDSDTAALIAKSITKMFYNTHRIQSSQTFGDPSISILDVADVPEFNKFHPKEKRVSVLRHGVYAIRKVQTDFDGGLRQSIECRKLLDIDEFDTVDEIGNAIIDIDENAIREININETGV